MKSYTDNNLAETLAMPDKHDNQNISEKKLLCHMIAVNYLTISLLKLRKSLTIYYVYT